MSLKNVNVAMPTPINSLNQVELSSINPLLSYYEKNFIESVLVCGSTGEQHSLKLAEKLSIVDYIDEKNHSSLEIIFGISSLFFQEAIDLVQKLENSSINAMMLGFPPYMRMSQREAISYTETMISKFSRDVLLYNNPGRTGFDLSVDSLAFLVNKYPNIIGIKEAGNPEKAGEIRYKLGNEFQLFAGGDFDLLSKWKQGYNGLSSIIANIYPREISELVDILTNKSPMEAKTFFSFIDEMNGHLNKGSTLPNLKYLMNHKGLPVGQCRLPLGIVEDDFIKKVHSDFF